MHHAKPHKEMELRKINRRNFLRKSLVSAGGLALLNVPTEVYGHTTQETRKGKMIYRMLGKTGLEVSVIALGCEGFNKKTEQQVKVEFDFAMSHGINFLDLYASNPTLRSNIGYALKGRRKQMIIQGHLGAAWEDGQYLRTRNIGMTKAAFNDLLQRLQTDYIDIGMIHYVDEEDDFDKIITGDFLKLVKEYRQSGKIRHVGISTHSPLIAMKAAKSGVVEVIMLSVNPGYDLQIADGKITHMTPEREQLYEYCAGKGIAITVMKAFGGGNLLNDGDSPFGRAFTPVQCIEYAATRPAVAAIMCGAKTVSEMQAALHWCEATGGEKDFMAVLSGVTSTDWKGRCMYCTHCEPCPEEIPIAEVNKYLNLTLAQNEVPETVREHYKLLTHHASDCSECAQCELRCPFEVSIIENMKRAVKVFGM